MRAVSSYAAGRSLLAPLETREYVRVVADDEFGFCESLPPRLYGKITADQWDAFVGRVNEVTAANVTTLDSPMLMNMAFIGSQFLSPLLSVVAPCFGAPTSAKTSTVDAVIASYRNSLFAVCFLFTNVLTMNCGLQRDIAIKQPGNGIGAKSKTVLKRIHVLQFDLPDDDHDDQAEPAMLEPPDKWSRNDLMLSPLIYKASMGGDLPMLHAIGHAADVKAPVDDKGAGTIKPPLVGLRFNESDEGIDFDDQWDMEPAVNVTGTARSC